MPDERRRSSVLVTQLNERLTEVQAEADRLRAENEELKAEQQQRMTHREAKLRAERDEARAKRDIAERASADRWDALQDTMRERSRLRAALREIDSAKLGLLAKWLDAEQAARRWNAENGSTEVQDDLRRWEKVLLLALANEGERPPPGFMGGAPGAAEGEGE